MNEVMLNAEVLLFGMVHYRGLSVPLGPHDAGFPLEFHVQRVYLTVFGHFQQHLARQAVSAGERVGLIDRVVSDFQTFHGARHRALFSPTE